MGVINVKLEDMNYENVVAICPSCNHRNVYNRATDLMDQSIISYGLVKCQNINCGQDLNLIGDIVNPPYELLILDCTQLIEERKYAYCILNLTQSFEMFFALFLRVEIVFKPYAEENWNNPFNFNKALANLEKYTKNVTFNDMRSLFLNYIILTKVLMKRNATSLFESEIILNQLKKNSPSKDVLQSIEDDKLSNLLINLQSCEINSIRNNVVHKRGYRPSLATVEKALNETQGLIYGLNSCLAPLIDKPIFYKIMKSKSVTFS